MQTSMPSRLGVSLALLLSLSARADVFSVTGEIPGVTSNTADFESIEDLFETLESENLGRLLTGYTENSPAILSLDVRGLPAIATYSANSTTLTFTVPSLGIFEVFSGPTRDASEAQFEDFIESNGNDILKSMLKELAATTPIDPVAGNPNSVMAMMGVADFGFGTDFNMGPSMSVTDVMATGDNSSSSSTVSLGISAGRFSAGEYDNELISLPIQYTRYGKDPRHQFRLSMPISYTDTDGAATYNLSLGMGYRFPITDDWSLTPAVRAGAVGSEDLGSAAVVYSASLTSNYNFYLEDLKISLGNMVGYYATESLDAGDYEIDYDLQNGMTKNGLSFEGSTGGTLLDLPTSWQAAVVHSLFWGDDLYIEEFYDLSLTWGTRLANVAATSSSLRVGLSYTVGEKDFDGFRLNFGYTF